MTATDKNVAIFFLKQPSSSIKPRKIDFKILTRLFKIIWKMKYLLIHHLTRKKKKKLNLETIPVFCFSPGSTLLPLGLTLLHRLRPKGDLTGGVPTGWLVRITRQLNSARVNLGDIMNKHLIMFLDIPGRLSGKLIGDLLPAIRNFIGEQNKSVFEELILEAVPVSWGRVKGVSVLIHMKEMKMAVSWSLVGDLILRVEVFIMSWGCGGNFGRNNSDS